MKTTFVYAIAIQTGREKGWSSHIEFYRYDPRVKHEDTGRLYKAVTPSSRVRVEALMARSDRRRPVDMPWALRVTAQFHPFPVERRGLR